MSREFQVPRNIQNTYFYCASRQAYCDDSTEDGECRQCRCENGLSFNVEVDKCTRIRRNAISKPKGDKILRIRHLSHDTRSRDTPNRNFAAAKLATLHNSHEDFI